LTSFVDWNAVNIHEFANGAAPTKTPPSVAKVAVHITTIHQSLATAAEICEPPAHAAMEHGQRNRPRASVTPVTPGYE
jgi:hypothetical protein